MRLLLSAFAVLLLVAGSAAAHPPGVADKDQAVAHEVEAFREFIMRAIDKRDVKLLRAIHADGFTHTYASGRIEDRDARVAAILAGDAVIDTAPAEGLLYRVFGDRTIIVTGRSALRDLKEKRTDKVRWSIVYVKLGGDWKIAMSQATRLP